MRIPCKRALATGLTLSMLLSMVPLHTMAAQPGSTLDGYSDPWNTSASMPELTPKDAITSPTFTGKEWTGETVGEVHNEDVFAVNREESSLFASSGVICDSVDAAPDSAIHFNKEASGYVQFLTGADQADWSLRVVKNDTIAKADCPDFYETDFVPDDQWSTDLPLPASWTQWGLDYPIYTNTQVPWQEDSTSSDTARRQPAASGHSAARDQPAAPGHSAARAGASHRGRQPADGLCRSHGRCRPPSGGRRGCPQAQREISATSATITKRRGPEHSFGPLCFPFSPKLESYRAGTARGRTPPSSPWAQPRLSRRMEGCFPPPGTAFPPTPCNAPLRGPQAA